MQGTFSGVHAHYRRAVPTIRAAVCLFACLFHYCHFGGPKWHHLARSIITIVDMSRVYTGWFGDPGDEAPHRICFPDVERERQIVCICWSSHPRWAMIWLRARSIGKLARPP
jgi:hypothetical protein